MAQPLDANAGPRIVASSQTWKQHNNGIDDVLAKYAATPMVGEEAKALVTRDKAYQTYQDVVPRLWQLASAGVESGFVTYRNGVVTPAATAATDALDYMATLENAAAQQTVRADRVSAELAELWSASTLAIREARKLPLGDR